MEGTDVEITIGMRVRVVRGIPQGRTGEVRDITVAGTCLWICFDHNPHELRGISAASCVVIDTPPPQETVLASEPKDKGDITP